jgi:hypothetical protein
MDINKIVKPLHIRCPKCGADLEYNPRRIKDRLDNIKMTYQSIQRQMPTITDKDVRKKKVKELERLQFTMKLLKEDNNMVSTLLKEETDRIMREMVRDIIGEEEWMRLLHKAEERAREENVFRTYELAIQSYSNIPDSAN